VVDDFKPSVAILDPISSLASAGTTADVYAALMRLIDFLKNRRITCMCTSLSTEGIDGDRAAVGVSSLMDTWILVKDLESTGERNRGLYVLKSRGMAHSNQIHEFRLTSSGVQLRDVYLGPPGVPTGAARAAHKSMPRQTGRRRRTVT